MKNLKRFLSFLLAATMLMALGITASAAEFTDVPAGSDYAEAVQWAADEVLLPARSGQRLIYRPFDCRTGSQKPPSVLPTQLLTVVEGSYSHHPLLDSQYDLKIFLTCSKQEQSFRLAAREGEHLSAFTEIWIPLEEQYFQHCQIKEHSDIVVDTSSFFE